MMDEGLAPRPMRQTSRNESHTCRPFFDYALTHLAHVNISHKWHQVATFFSVASCVLRWCVAALTGLLVAATFEAHGQVDVASFILCAAVLATAYYGLPLLAEPETASHVIRTTCFDIPIDQWTALSWAKKLTVVVRRSVGESAPWLRSLYLAMLSCGIVLLLDHRALAGALASWWEVHREMALAQMELINSLSVTVVCGVAFSYMIGYNINTVWADAAHSLRNAWHERQEWTRASLDTHVNISLMVLKAEDIHSDSPLSQSSSPSEPVLEFFTIGEMRFEAFFNHPVVAKLVRSAMERVRHVHELSFLCTRAFLPIIPPFPSSLPFLPPLPPLPFLPSPSSLPFLLHILRVLAQTPSLRRITRR